MAASKPKSKSQLLADIAEKTGLPRKQVAAVFEALGAEVAGAVKKKGVGVFTIPGLMKVTVVTKPATPKRKGINPFTKQEQIFAAKPARRVVKVRPLKALKDMAAK